MSRSRQELRSLNQPTASAPASPTLITTAGRTFMSPPTRSPVFFFKTTATGRFVRPDCWRVWRSISTEGLRPEWASVLAITTETASSTLSRPISPTTPRLFIEMKEARCSPTLRSRAALPGKPNRSSGELPSSISTTTGGLTSSSWEGPFILREAPSRRKRATVSSSGTWETVASKIFPASAVGDIFHTGQLDLLINNINDRPLLLRNESPSPNSWLLVRLIGSKTNRAAIGSRVLLEANGQRQLQEVQSGGSFCSQNDLRLHFGLGTAREARLEVHWLSGARETFERIGGNRLVTIQEGKGILSQDTF